MKGYLCPLLLVLCMANVVLSDVFSSFADIQQSVYVEKDLSQEIRRYIKEQQAKLDQIKSIANKLDEHNAHTEGNSENYLSNPVNAYLHVKTLSTEWEKAVNFIKNNDSEEFLTNVVNMFGRHLPCQEDVTGAGQALLRLQDTYNLPTEKIAKGDLQGVKESPHLTAGDCFELGKMAYNIGDYYHSVSWFGEALNILNRETNKTTDKAVLLDYLSYSIYMQGNIEHALNMTKEWLELDPGHKRAQTNKIYYEKMLREAGNEAKKHGKPVQKPVFKNERTEGLDFKDYEALCRGEDIVPNPNAHKLTCRFTTKNNHPLLILNPLKEETLYDKPWIAFYHDVIRDNDIEIIKELAYPKLHRSGVFTWKGGNNNTVQNYRTSKSAWLPPNEHPRLEKLERKLEALSGLSLETAEMLQVLNYGIAGHYAPHYDFARREETNTFEEWRGNRIVTVIFYLNNVPAGGATVFPKLGARVWPEKGGCAFWFNLHRHGEGDFDTIHAGCPVLTGSKWVCNKWIHERGQELIPTRRCTLNPEE